MSAAEPGRELDIETQGAITCLPGMTYLTECLGDEDVVDARWQPNFCTASLHLFLLCPSLYASVNGSPISEQSSWKLSIHFFLGFLSV